MKRTTKASRERDPRLQSRQIGLGVAAGRHADDELHPGERRVGEARVIGRDPAFVGPGEQIAGQGP